MEDLMLFAVHDRMRAFETSAAEHRLAPARRSLYARTWWALRPADYRRFSSRNSIVRSHATRAAVSS